MKIETFLAKLTTLLTMHGSKMVMEKSAKSGHSYGFGAKTERFTSQSLSPDKSKMSPFTIFIVTAIEVRSEKNRETILRSQLKCHVLLKWSSPNDYQLCIRLAC